ncbi:MAG: hypothetical protein HW419_3160, partial [Deltaproteobacteria bacterium]|nr:hypothetical protein [Deltaproteobacteria bacterium]
MYVSPCRAGGVHLVDVFLAGKKAQQYLFVAGAVAA